jgi:hypothetical protein
MYHDIMIFQPANDGSGELRRVAATSQTFPGASVASTASTWNHARMKTHLLTLVLLTSLPFAGCGMTGNDTAATKSLAVGSVDVNKLLASITDGPTAEAAKGPLDSVVASLKGLAGGAVAEATTGAKKIGADTLAKYGISGETLGMITGLLGNPAVTSVIGPTLNQLKGLLSM